MLNRGTATAARCLPLLGKFDAVVTDPPICKVKGDFDQE